ncbi:unnamed protein product [Adineta ricciae]|uniref:Uncharacterized protein n=1 Tax=Adineta ricciae TaxID=249248 RepID=A0A815V6J5_ADIRI|nr:unnamed protein product [Adineta ricciae]
MDYLLRDGRQAVRPIGYGFHHTGRNASGENGNIRRYRSTHASVIRRVETIRLHRHNPLVRAEPGAVGTGKRRTVARRERRERAHELHHPTTSPLSPPTTITPPTSSSSESVVVEDNKQQGNDGEAINSATYPPQRTIIVYNSNMGSNHNCQEASKMATLNLSDDESL